MASGKPLGESIEIINKPNKQGVKIPQIGFGVYQVAPGPECEEAVACALQEGYRHIDTAALYRNEAAVGAAIRNSGLRREEVFVTTKLWNADHGYQNCLQAFQRSLNALELDYVDLYLVHSPMRVDKRLETWRAFEAILQSGKAKAIGVSNYGIHHLRELMQNCKVMPAVNQIEVHPYNRRQELVDFCKQHGIAIQAYSPLTKGRRLKDPELVEIAGRYHKTPAQVLIRWSLQKGYIVLPKSVTPQRILQNIQVFDFEISPVDMAKLDALDEGLVTGWDPTIGA